MSEKLKALLGLAAVVVLAAMVGCVEETTTPADGGVDKCKDVTCENDNTCDPKDGKCKCGEGPACTGNKQCENDECKLPPANECFDTKGATDVVWLINHLELATPDQGCDFTGDGEPDNAVSTILEAFKSELGDQDPNEMIQEELDKGTILVLMETKGLKNYEDACFDMNLYQGMDNDCFDAAHPEYIGEDEKPTSDCREANAADNFSGTEDFRLDPDSFDDQGKPLITYEKSRIFSGDMEAGPSTFNFIIPVQETVYNVGLKETSILATASATKLEEGMICGYVLNQTIIDIVCDIPEAAEYCETVSGMLPSVADIDLDGDTENGYEAFSLAALFTATTAKIVSGE